MKTCTGSSCPAFPQDSRLPDLPPTLKHPMEAPLQTGMVRAGGCVALRGLLIPTCSAHTMRSRENSAASVQALLRFPACITGRRAVGKSFAPREGATPAHPADGDIEAWPNWHLLGGELDGVGWGMGRPGPQGGLGGAGMRCAASAFRPAGVGRDDWGRSCGGHGRAHPSAGAEASRAE